MLHLVDFIWKLVKKKDSTTCMNEHSISIHLHHGCAVAMFQEEISGDLISVFELDLLAKIDMEEVLGVIIDLSGVRIIDGEDTLLLDKLFRKCRLMGTEVVISGLRPSVVASIVINDLSLNVSMCFHSIDDALNYFINNK